MSEVEAELTGAAPTADPSAPESRSVPALSDYARATAVEPIAPGRYRAQLSERWCLPNGNVGGAYLLGTALDALARELPMPDPIVASATYLRPARPAPAEVEVEVVRLGRRLAVGEARLFCAGKEIVRVIATFADLAAAQTQRFDSRLVAPSLPAPEECVPFPTQNLPQVTIAQRLEYRYPALPGWIAGVPSQVAEHEFWMRLADGSPADTRSLAALVDAALPPIYELGIWTSTTVELTSHVRAVPAPGWLACRASSRHLAGGLHEEDFEIWDSAGVLVAQSRQLMMDVS